MRQLVFIAIAFFLSGCASLEKAALPEPVLLEPIWQVAAPTATVEIDQSAWDTFLSRFLKTDTAGINRLDYGSVTANDHNQLRVYISRLEQINTKTLSQDQQLAYWFNLYNAKTVDLVLEAYPVDSILDIKDGFLPTGPWNRKVVRVNSQELSLNDIEHRIVRPVFEDPRIHYALNCAAAGCPNLMPRAWRAETLEADLDAAERAYVNDPRGIRFDANGRLTLSKIYSWFSEDFGNDEEEVLEDLLYAASPELQDKLYGRTSVDPVSYTHLTLPTSYPV